MGRPRKIPDPWQPQADPETLENGQPVQIWSNQSTGERRLVPVGLHPSQQPLADPEPEEDDEEEEDTPESRMFALMQQAQQMGGVTLRLYRMERGNKLAWLEDYSAAEWEEGGEAMVRDTFGAGDYEVRFWQKGVRSPLKAKFSFHIAGPRGGHVPAPAPVTDPNLTQLLSSVAENQRAMLQALTERPAPADPTVEMQKMLALMVTMRQALGIENQPKSQIGEIVTAIRELREASEEIAPQKDTEDGLMGQLPRVLDLIQSQQSVAQPQPEQVLAPVHLPVSMFEDRQRARAAAVEQVVQPPKIENPSPKVTPQPEEQPVFNPLILLNLRGYLKTLIANAVKGVSVEKSAQLVYDKLPDEIVDLMALDNWWDLLVEVDAHVEPHKAYLTKVRDTALAKFEVDEDDEGEPAEDLQQPAKAAHGC